MAVTGGVQKERCRGSQVLYEGKCRYPKEVRALKAKARREAEAAEAERKRVDEEAAAAAAAADVERRRLEEEQQKAEAERLDAERRAADEARLQEETRLRLEAEAKLEEERKAREAAERAAKEERLRHEQEAADEKERTRPRLHLLGGYAMGGGATRGEKDGADAIGPPGDVSGITPIGLIIEGAPSPYIYLGFMFEAAIGVSEEPAKNHIYSLGMTIRGRYPFADDTFEVFLLVPLALALGPATSEKEGSTNFLYGFDTGVSLGFAVTMARVVGLSLDFGYRYYGVYCSAGARTADSLSMHLGTVNVGLFFRF
jgi:hypothetical protein